MSDGSMIDRRGQRRRIGSSVLLRNSMGLKIHADLFDVSEFGCAIATKGSRLEVGRIYTLKTPGIETIGGEVVWVKDHHAGLKFIEPLYPAVAENLARMFPRQKESPASDSLLVEMARQRPNAERG